MNEKCVVGLKFMPIDREIKSDCIPVSVQDILQQWRDDIQTNSKLRGECLRENDKLRDKAYQKYLTALKKIDVTEKEIIQAANNDLNRLADQYMTTIAEFNNEK